YVSAEHDQGEREQSGGLRDFCGGPLCVVDLVSCHCCWRLFDDDYDFSARVTFFQITDRSLRFTEFVGSIDDWRYFSGLHQVAQNIQIVFGSFRNVEDELLAGEL